MSEQDQCLQDNGFHRGVLRFSAMFFFVFLGAGAQQAYLVRYLERAAGWNQVRCSLVIATVYFTMVVFRIANLRLFRGWDDRKCTFIGSLSYLLFCVVMGCIQFTPSYTLALAGAVIWGIGAALMWAGTTMQILAYGDRAGGKHGTGMGILYSSTHAGWLTGAIVLGLIYRILPTPKLYVLYVVAASSTLVGNVLAYMAPREDRGPPDMPSIAGALALMRKTRAQIACVLQFLSALAYGLILGVFGKFVEHAYGREWVWVAVSLYPATRMVLSLAGGVLTDRLGPVRVLVAGFLSGALGLLVCVFWQSPLASILTSVTLGLLSSTIPIVASSIIGNAADRKRRPLAYGIIFAWRDLGVATAIVASNFLGEYLRMEEVFLVFSLLFAGCAVISLRLGKVAEQKF